MVEGQEGETNRLWENKRTWTEGRKRKNKK